MAFVVAGGAAGALWRFVAPLPGYIVTGPGSASLDAVGLTEVFGPDASFMLIGVLGGAVIGGAVMWWHRDRGPWLVPLVVAAAAIAALTCWRVGLLLVGPRDFEAEIAAARPGQVLAGPLELRAPVVLAGWPAGAAIIMAVLAVARWYAFTRGRSRAQAQQQPQHLVVSETEPGGQLLRRSGETSGDTQPKWPPTQS